MKGNFQIIVIVLFIAGAVFGVLVFSGAIPIGNNDTPGALGTVVLWGTVKGENLSSIITDFNNSNPAFIVKYVEKSGDTFENTFAGASEVFLTSKGILAYPLAIDPLVMYYNRSILDANAIVYPPVFWDEFYNLISLITKKDDSGKIIKSAVALGHFSNIAHAKDILTALFMQAKIRSQRKKRAVS